MSAYHFLKNFPIVYVDWVVANFAGYSIEKNSYELAFMVRYFGLRVLSFFTKTLKNFEASCDFT